MSSDVDICSQALAELGEEPIASLTQEDSDEAVICNALWLPTYRGVLRMHPWNCSTRRATLAATGTDPVHRWSTAFARPPDDIRVFEAYSGEHELEKRRLDKAAYRVEGRQILADEDVITIAYASQIGTEELDPLLEWAIATTLAGRMAYAITGSRSVQDQMVKLGSARVEEAKAANSVEQPNDIFRPSRLEQVRRGAR